MLKVGDTYYAYGTNDGVRNIPLLTSTDLVRWSDPEEALPLCQGQPAVRRRRGGLLARGSVRRRVRRRRLPDLLLYHAWPPDAMGSEDPGRTTWLDRVEWVDGKPVVRGPTTDPQPAPEP